MYQAKVKAVITNLPRNRADVKIEIIEGKAAEIAHIVDEIRIAPIIIFWRLVFIIKTPLYIYLMPQI